jgi:hypothetical protein
VDVTLFAALDLATEQVSDLLRSETFVAGEKAAQPPSLVKA